MDLEALRKRAAGIPVAVHVFGMDVIVEPMMPEDRFVVLSQVRELRTSEDAADPQRMDATQRAQYMAIARAAVSGHVTVDDGTQVLVSAEDPLWRLISIPEVERMFAARLYGDDKSRAADAGKKSPGPTKSA